MTRFSAALAVAEAGDTYVRGLTVNGKPSQRTYVDLNGTRELDFTLAKTPDTRRGTALGDAPPSFGGPVQPIRPRGPRAFGSAR